MCRKKALFFHPTEKDKKKDDRGDRDKKRDKDKDKEKTKYVTENPALLLAFVYFDQSHTGYLLDKDAEEILHTLGLHLSRSQVLISILSSHNRPHGLKMLPVISLRVFDPPRLKAPPLQISGNKRPSGLQVMNCAFLGFPLGLENLEIRGLFQSRKMIILADSCKKVREEIFRTKVRTLVSFARESVWR